MSETARRQTDCPLSAPNAEGSVWPRQSCQAFFRRAAAPGGLAQCWYCRHAGFHLERPRALDVVVCCWPKKILD